ncbi:MAG: 1-acyl-sn-glycerol-3-phosphate acyltransferase [Myxococcota bacterium]|jgi:1-acyl-sn-glycerol-3-phosphate acyltransferase
MRADSARWRRRSLTVPLYLLAAATALALLPLLAVIALGLDLVTRRRMAVSRAILFATVYLCCEAAGILVAVLLWLARPLIGHARFLSGNHTLQRAWSQALLHSLVGIFQIRLVVEGAEALAGGPLLLLVRHASMIDTVLPMHLVTIPHRYRARYVLKAELLWDPCLDIVGNRVPNAFIQRGAGASEVAEIAALGADLSDDGLVVLFPEGTRFSPSRRDRRLGDMAKRDDPMLAAATSLRHTLPPRSGGAIGLIEAAPTADVAFCTHTGLEGIQGFAQLPSLVGREVRVAFWRIPAAAVPTTDRRGWLMAEWGRVDAWIAEQGTMLRP